MSQRTRGKAKKNQNQGQMEMAAEKSKFDEGGNLDAPKAKGENLDMSQLLKHMENMQRKTEQSTVESLKEAMEASKKSLNSSMKEMIASLTQSVGEMKIDLQGVKESFRSEIQCVKDEVHNVNLKLETAMDEIKSLESDSRSYKQSLEVDIKSVKNDTTKSLNLMNDQLVALSRELNQTVEQGEKRAQDQERKIEELKKGFEEELDRVKIRAYGNSNELRQHSSQIETLDSQARSQNIIIDGMPEKSEEETKSDLAGIIAKSLPDFTASSLKSVRRLGKNVKRKKVRPILVGLADAGARERILAKAADIRKGADNAQFWINRDQSASGKRKYGLIKACFKLMQANNYECTMKGSIIS